MDNLNAILVVSGIQFPNFSPNMVDNLNAILAISDMQFQKILSKYTFAIFNIGFDSQIQEKSKICPDLEFLKDL